MDRHTQMIRSYAVYLAAREAKNMRDADVAKASGVNNSVFCDWKMRRYMPKHDKLMQIAEVLGIAVDEFYK